MFYKILNFVTEIVEKSRQYLKFISFFLSILFNSMNQTIVSTNEIAAKYLSRFYCSM